MKNKPTINAIDLFCGIGGLSYGLKSVGINVVAGIDIDKSCKYAYEANNANFINKHISDVSSKELNSYYEGGDIKVLVGCAPCQTFSKHTQKVRNRDKSEKWRLLDVFAKKVDEIHPEIVSMENVPQLMKYNIFNEFVSKLKQFGYHTSYQIVHCPSYGIPQNRSRLVLMASLRGNIKLIPITHTPAEYVTVRNVIGGLEEVKHGNASEKDKLHKCSLLTSINVKRIKQSVPGGTWNDWDKDLLLKCHMKVSGQSYSSVYGRMEWDKPSPTITTQFFSFGTGRFGHPEQNRALSLREGALLQTFPKDYKFFEENKEVSIKHIGRHIGNAVPVKLGEVIGKSIIAHIEGAL